MSDHCSPFCPFLGCQKCNYRGGQETTSEEDK